MWLCRYRFVFWGFGIRWLYENIGTLSVLSILVLDCCVVILNI